MSVASILPIGADTELARELTGAGFLLSPARPVNADVVLLLLGEEEPPHLPTLAGVRAAFADLPLLVLSRAADRAGCVAALDAGADDWLATPHDTAELAARLRALARRGGRTRYHDLVVDRIERRAFRAERDLGLIARELALLLHLLRHRERVVSRGELLAGVWGARFDPGTNSIAVHMSRLRTKLDRGFATRLLHTISGEGYMLSAGHGLSLPPCPADLRRRAAPPLSRAAAGETSGHARSTGSRSGC